MENNELLKEIERKKRTRKTIKKLTTSDEGELIATPNMRRNARKKTTLKPGEFEIRKSVEETETVKIEKLKEDITCLVARSALILPFNVKSPPNSTQPINVLLTENILSRNVTLTDQKTKGLKTVPLWRVLTSADLPHEVADLSAIFRQHLVWRMEEKYQDERTWTCRRFVMCDLVRTHLFDKAQIQTIQNGEVIVYPASFTNVEILLFPIGCLQLVIHVNWMPPNQYRKTMDPITKIETLTQKLTLPEFRTLLYVSKYRDKVESTCRGWSFYDEAEKDILIPETVLGKELFGAKYHKQSVSMRTLCQWLLQFSYTDEQTEPWFDSYPPESILVPAQPYPSSYQCYQTLPTPSPSTIDISVIGDKAEVIHNGTSSPRQFRASKEHLYCESTRHAQHHSTVVISEEIRSEILHEYLFYLKRAFGQKNMPPVKGKTTIGKVLIWRKNRYIGISREGTVSISWPTSTFLEDDFEVNSWFRKFQGIYLLFSQFVQGERMVFLELSDLSASFAEKLRLVQDDTSLSEMRGSRDVMRSLATRMVRYTLSMCSDVGGISEYSEFFASMRKIFDVVELRNELSNELKDVLAAIESNYLEEERRQREAEEREKHIQRELQKREKN